jgi:hypothetical protein
MTPQLLSKSPEKGHQHVNRREAGSNSAQSFRGLHLSINCNVGQQACRAAHSSESACLGVLLRPKLIVGGAVRPSRKRSRGPPGDGTPDAIATASAGRQRGSTVNRQ